MENIDSIVVFEGKAPEAAAPEAKGEVATTVETTATPAESENNQERNERGQFKAKEPEKAPEAKPEAKPETQVQPEAARAEKGQISALLAERGRRQQAENEAAQLKARIAQLESGQTAEFDPDRAISERVQREVAPLRNRLFMQSIESAGAAHADYEEVIGHFLTLAENNPQLRQQFVDNENPGEFAYLVGSSTPQYREQRERSFTDQISSKDAEITALKAKVAELEGSKQKLSEIPESLNRQPSGAVPNRGDGGLNVNDIVRFK